MSRKFKMSSAVGLQLFTFLFNIINTIHPSNSVNPNYARKVEKRFLIPGVLDVKSLLDFFGPAILGNPKPPLPECTMSTPELLKYYGYPVKVHLVTTKDNYILELHRIPYGKTGPGSKLRVPVFLQHGALSSSIDWVMNFPDQSLGFMLADKGYDVWIGNYRGNTYSNKHKTLNKNQKKFWDFCNDDLAKYDLPAAIEYVLNETGRPNLYYIGHSMGCLGAFAMLSTNHNFDKKIKRFLALAPVTTLANIKSIPFKYIVFPLIEVIKSVFDFFGIYDFFSNSKLTKAVGWSLCAKPATNRLCTWILEVIVGEVGPQLNTTRLPFYFSNFPAGMSIKSIQQFSQTQKSKVFSYFDYGSRENLIKYNKRKPPVYDLTNIEVPIAIISTQLDLLAPPEDILTIVNAIPNLIEHYVISGYNHQDVLWATDTASRVNEKILSWMDPNIS